MTRIILCAVTFLFFFSACKQKTSFSDWRGPERDGVYNETNLLKEWPDDGPEMLWSFEGLGYGHSSVAVANNKVYITGIKDTISSLGTLFTFDLEGNLLWEKDYGKDFTLNFHGTRSTPVIVDNLIYIESGMGAVYCLNAENGEEIWSIDFIEDLGVDSVIQFGFSESVLIEKEKLFCVPGGKENNVVALNRFDGTMIWKSAGNGEPATYNSPVFVEHNQEQLIIAMTTESIMGIQADTGEMYWRIEHTQQNKIHANTPIYKNGKVLVATPDRSDTSGMVLIELAEDGKDAEVVWRNEKIRSFMGGAVVIDTAIYVSAYLRENWEVINWNTGEMLTQNKDFGGGPIIYADGMFYLYAERDGKIALADANPNKFEIVSQFDVPMGTKEHWAHPVISDGVLYVRHGNAVMAYNIKSV